MQTTPRPPMRLTLCAGLAIAACLCSLNAASFGDDDDLPKPVTPVVSDRNPAETRILASLGKPCTVEFIETPLSDAVLFLSETYNLSILLDTRVLDGVGIGSDAPITLKLKDVSLRSVLTLMLRDLELTYVIRDEVLLVTTYEESESELVNHVYDVPDLVASPIDGEPDPDSLIDMITTIVAPDTWDFVGGAGNVSELRGSLVVSQTGDIHDQVQALLTELRQAKHALAKNPQQAFKRRWNLADPLGGATAKIVAALEKPSPKFNLKDVPLTEVVEYISTHAEIPIVLDRRSLDSIGIGADTPVTLRLEGVSLRSALKIMLRELELTTVIRNEVLQITAVEEAESYLNTSIFLVRDLLGPPGAVNADADDLISLITTTVAPDTWDEVGGPASIQYFELIDALVVSQMDENHDEIETLITKMRKVHHARDPWSVEKWEAQRAEFLKTPRFETFTISQEPSGQLAVEAAVVVRFLENSLDKKLIERSQLKINHDSITMFLTPKEAASVNALFRKSKLPVFRDGDQLQGGGGGFGSGAIGAGSGGGFF